MKVSDLKPLKTLLDESSDTVGIVGDAAIIGLAAAVKALISIRDHEGNIDNAVVSKAVEGLKQIAYIISTAAKVIRDSIPEPDGSDAHPENGANTNW